MTSSSREPSPAPAPSGADDRFDRQVRFAPLGRAGQEHLEASRALLVGCGALGGVLAQSLVRAGIGALVLADRDVVEPSNLPRQVLFDERHAREGTPKALAAAETLARAGGPTRLLPEVVHVDVANLAALARGAALVLDGTDNLATRYLLNDFCVERGLPWIYAGVVGGAGLVLPVLPGRGACLRCVFPEPAPAGALPTCDSAGVILPAVGAVASLAAGLALRVLAGERALAGLEPALIEVDAWHGGVRRLAAPQDPDCPCCARREFPWLHQPPGRAPAVLCGRNTVQVPGAGASDLDALARRLAGVASDVRHAGVLLRFSADGVRFSVFPDGRALVEGTEDVDRARALYDRWVGA
jgi:adenylyltransferase/sulfurtransferase